MVLRTIARHFTPGAGAPGRSDLASAGRASLVAAVRLQRVSTPACAALPRALPNAQAPRAWAGGRNASASARSGFKRALPRRACERPPRCGRPGRSDSTSARSRSFRLSRGISRRGQEPPGRSDLASARRASLVATVRLQRVSTPACAALPRALPNAQAPRAWAGVATHRLQHVLASSAHCRAGRANARRAAAGRVAATRLQRVPGRFAYRAAFHAGGRSPRPERLGKRWTREPSRRGSTSAR